MPNNNRRNWVARAAIMRKGGVHEKTHKAKRKQAKQALKKKIRAEQFGSFFCTAQSCFHSIRTCQADQ